MRVSAGAAVPAAAEPEIDTQRRCDEQGGEATGRAAAARTPSSLLDQRLRVVLAWWVWRRGDRHEANMSSTMLHVKVNRLEPYVLHEQVAAEIRRAIAEGEAKPGERLPPARDLAAVLGVNTNTVLRALRALRDEGLLEFRRGRGITVSGVPERGMLVARARELVRFARQQGYKPDELIRIIEDVS